MAHCYPLPIFNNDADFEGMNFFLIVLQRKTDIIKRGAVAHVIKYNPVKLDNYIFEDSGKPYYQARAEYRQDAGRSTSHMQTAINMANGLTGFNTWEAVSAGNFKQNR